MSIIHETSNSKYVSHIFKLDTPNTSYVLCVVDEEGFVGHLYYGSKINDCHLENLIRINEMPFVPSHNNRDRGSFLDSFPMEYSTNGIGDYRESCLSIETEGGFEAVGLTYLSYDIVEGKNKILGLPATFGKKEDVNSLILHCIDKATGLNIDLIYSAFDDVDVITRSVKIINKSSENIYLTKVFSTCLDMDNKDFNVTSLNGSWARERHKETVPVGHNRLSIESFRGETSHQDHPFMMLSTPNTTDETGEVYAMNFVYSGNFKATVMNNQFDQIRMVMGIHPDNFKWKLLPDESFESPEVVMLFI